ncbi:U3 small nucleolar ribonucleoprotein IMP4 [Colletotrichum gloeosporioides]|uniref:U3 small nucleolar ribonucleoprotein protein IMP4 n=1 Tax=Colletotrichum gloeosporioides TaxID=474922 RepID=A0A8H4C5A5_COLGL|nr:U3 small nucleolar ribonucleoprotein IMP4 [Colletotrichum gloeosporioides]KAF3797384.1 U3 small nucleolar ribonucleoprotein IMP4 [Colletotrichum gloeosporioides]
MLTSVRRARLKESLATGKSLPVDTANDARLRKDFSYDESAEALQSLDDEYETLSGLQDPRVLIATSRSPSSRLQGSSKDLRLLMPTATVINRGTMTLQDLVRVANATGLTDIVHVHEHRGTPSALTISHLPHGPTISFSLHNVKTRQDLPNALRGNISKSYPPLLSVNVLTYLTDLIFDGFSTELGKRVQRVLQHLFPPRDSSMKAGNRTVTSKRLEDDSIEVRHHLYVRTGYDQLELSEVGPRVTMRTFSIRNCTLEEREGGVEWQMNHYTRTARKKTVL